MPRFHSIVVLLTLLPVAANATEPFAGLDPYVAAAMKQWEVPGLAIAFVKDGETVLAREYGVCELGTGRQVTAETAFPIASCAKSFTAAALALLVDEGKLGWDDPIVKHLPEFQVADPYATRHATVRDLLCHRTGLRRADLLQDGAGFDPSEVLRRLKHLELAASFRTRLIYNNHTYTVLSELVERVSGQPYERFVKERLWQPLKMKSLASNLPKERRALRHWRSDAGIIAREPSSTDGVYATTADMAQWLKLHLAAGGAGRRPLIKPGSMREMHALQFSEPVRLRPTDNVYAAQFHGAGLGWFVQDYRGRKIVLHTGAWGAVIAMMPEENLGVVVLSNLDLESLPALLMYDVFDAYLIGAERTWDADKWQATWLKNEPPGNAYRPRDAARAELEKARQPGTRPSQPPTLYVGEYSADLYGTLTVTQKEADLLVTMGEHTTGLSHWQDDSFYVRAPTRLTFDWLLTFDFKADGRANKVVVKHIGWDNSEKEHTFVRDP